MAKQLRQARAAARAAYSWLRHDLPEIVAPASMPDPPGFKPPPRGTQRDLLQPGDGTLQRLARTCRRYVDTWDAEKVRRERAEREGGDAGAQAAPQASLAEEFAAAAKGGSQAMKPFLASLYTSRAVAWKKAVQQFVDGYKAGFREAMAPGAQPEAVQQQQRTSDSDSGDGPASAKQTP